LTDRLPVIGFDLDMTLIDSRAAILASFAAVAAETGVAIDPAGVDSRLGIKLEDELAHWFPAGEIAPAMAIYRRHYPRLSGPLTSVLPGAREAVAAVRAAGARAAVISAKFGPAVWQVLGEVGLAVDEVFGEVHGPEKAAVLAALAAAAYVGDTPPDMAAALRAGAWPVGVTTGSFSGAELRAAGAAVVLGSLAEFPDWYARQAAGGLTPLPLLPRPRCAARPHPAVPRARSRPCRLRGDRPRPRSAAQPLPERPARRPGADVPAAACPGDVDPQLDRDAVAPRGTYRDVPAAHRDLAGIDHDARPGDEQQVATAHLGVQFHHGRGEDGLGEVEQHVPASHPHLQPAWHHPAAIPLGLTAADLHPREVLGLLAGRQRVPAGRRDDPRSRRLGQVRGQRRQLGVSPGIQRQLQALV
jgi:phosphoglycolate phosphatase